MFAYTIRRLLAAFVLLILMSIVTFLLFNASAQDPARLACGKNCTVEQIASVRHKLGYDKPIATQYVLLIKGLVAGRDFPDDAATKKNAPQTITHCGAPCFGYSNFQTSLVSTLIKERLPVSISVAFFAFVLWMVFGIVSGVIAALFRGRWPDKILVGLALVGYSFPTFFIGLVLYTYIALQWQLVPTPEYISPLSDPVGFLRGAILPAVTLAMIYIAGYVRLTRAYVLEAMGEDYLRTARAKGLNERTIVIKHTLRAALTPITTIAGLDLGALLAGTPITETVFNFNGVGKLTVQSATNGDLPTLTAIVLISAAFIIVANIVVDVLYAYIDPRVRYA
ncbi:MAG: peptide/nickel transport system permease protein [Pseudonocardiales bacterium]|jgi:peptide/nickel transport system permease protein|nr:peptide/nickel transport system permease protein [Pseudonocardiales bacterium]